MLFQLVFGAVVARLGYSYVRNVRAARKSELPYVSVPVFAMAHWWFAVQHLVVPLLEYIPGTKSWLALTVYFRFWHNGGEPFEQMQADTFMTVSPEGNVLWTRDPDVVMQLGKSCASARLMVDPLNIFGPSVAGTKGKEWGLYRRTLSSIFTEELYKRVWQTTLGEAVRLVDHAQISSSSSSVRHLFPLQHLIQTAKIHIASKVLFSRTCHWDDRVDADLPDGHHHALSYDSALHSVDRLIWIIALVPMKLLRILPFSICDDALVAFDEWKRYTQEMIRERLQRPPSNDAKPSRDLLDAFIEACPDQSALSKGDLDAGTAYSNAKPNSYKHVSPAAVSGNMFTAILGGHETSSNTLAIILLVLGCHPEVQQKLQLELDQVLGSRPREEWSYNGDAATLLQGYTGAVVYETMRLWPVVPVMLKSTHDKSKTVLVDGKQHVLAADTLIILHAAAAQRHQTHWGEAAADRPIINGEAYPHPMSSFNPDRWLTDDDQPDKSQQIDSSHRPEPWFTKTWVDRSRPGRERRQRAKLAKPGTFFPFSEGAMACPGARMALVELVAAVAAICKDWTIRLPIADGGSWEAARIEAARKLSVGIKFNVTLHVSTSIALELLGREGRFGNLVG